MIQNLLCKIAETIENDLKETVHQLGYWPVIEGESFCGNLIVDDIECAKVFVRYEKGEQKPYRICLV